MSNVMPTTRRDKKRKQTTRALLDEGLKLMAERGIHTCKVEEITRAAGVGKGTFFNYFSSKESFTARLVDETLDDLARRVKPVAMSPTDAESLVAGVSAVHLRYFQLRPHASALITQALSLDEQPGREVVARLTEHIDMISEIISPALESFNWPEDRVKELSLMIISISCGFFWFGAHLNLGHDTPFHLLDRLGRVLAKGLSSQS